VQANWISLSVLVSLSLNTCFVWALSPQDEKRNLSLCLGAAARGYGYSDSDLQVANDKVSANPFASNNHSRNIYDVGAIETDPKNPWYVYRDKKTGSVSVFNATSAVTIKQGSTACDSTESKNIYTFIGSKVRELYEDYKKEDCFGGGVSRALKCNKSIFENVLKICGGLNDHLDQALAPIWTDYKNANGQTSTSQKNSVH